MNRNEAKQIAETVSVEDLKQMFLNAQNGIKDWSKTSRANKGMTVGATFNVLTKCGIDEKTHILAKTNMVWEFGEWLPNYEKKIKPTKQQPAQFHQEPVQINDDWLNDIF